MKKRKYPVTRNRTTGQLTRVWSEDTQCWERLCSKCLEYWPETLEFFDRYYRRGGVQGYQCWCRACCAEYQRERLARKARKEASEPAV